MEKKNKSNVETFFRFLKENNAYKQFLTTLPKYRYRRYVYSYIEDDILLAFTHLILASNTIEKIYYWRSLKKLWMQNILNSSVDS